VPHTVFGVEIASMASLSRRVMRAQPRSAAIVRHDQFGRSAHAFLANGSGVYDIFHDIQHVACPLPASLTR